MEALGCDGCDCPDIELWPTLVMIPISLSADPHHAEETLITYARIFHKYNFAIYDPQREAILNVESLKGVFSSDIRSHHDALKGAIAKGDRKRPWWQFW
jgi:hypothetical protein